MPQISVVIPTYKHRDFVLATLDSVLAQTFTNYEVIVINDGSPDDTAEVLKPLVEAGRIRYFEQPNAGQAAARNRGIAEARGDYIAFLDDDDLWPADKLEWQISLLNASLTAVLAYGYNETIGEEPGQIFPDCDAPSGLVKPFFLRQNCIGSPGQTLIRTKALRSISGFDESLWGVDDWDLYIRLAACGEFLYRHQAALYYRCHSTNASQDLAKMYRHSCRLHRKHLGLLPRPNNFRAWFTGRGFIHLHYARHYIEQAWQLSAEGKRNQAREKWLHAIKIKPNLLLKIFVLKGLLLSFVPLFLTSRLKSQGNHSTR